jgi:hypothetical protein
VALILCNFFSHFALASFQVLDPRFKARLFKNNPDLFDISWVHGCSAAFETLLLTEYAGPTPSNGASGNSLTPSMGGKSALGSFLLQMDVLGPDTTQPMAHETPLEELSRYLAARCISADSDPLAWWKVEQHSFPSLAHMARDFLAIPGTQLLFYPMDLH